MEELGRQGSGRLRLSARGDGDASGVESFIKRRTAWTSSSRSMPKGYVYTKMSGDFEDECLELAKAWCKVRCSEEQPSTYLETDAVLRIIGQVERLEPRGRAHPDRGKGQSLQLREPLSEEYLRGPRGEGGARVDGWAQLMSRDFAMKELKRFRLYQ